MKNWIWKDLAMAITTIAYLSLSWYFVDTWKAYFMPLVLMLTMGALVLLRNVPVIEKLLHRKIFK